MLPEDLTRSIRHRIIASFRIVQFPLLRILRLLLITIVLAYLISLFASLPRLSIKTSAGLRQRAMPRAATLRSSQRQRPAPYGTRSTSHTMAVQMVSPYQQQYPPSWEQSQPSSYDQPQMHPMNMYNLEPTMHGSYELPTQPLHQRHQQHRSQSAPWTAQEDDRLLKSKRQGLQWDVIQKKYFPDKSTGNACRKRYERLENKRRATDWDEARLQKLAAAYIDMRQEIWGPLANKLGEKWDHVEKKVSIRTLTPFGVDG